MGFFNLFLVAKGLTWESLQNVGQNASLNNDNGECKSCPIKDLKKKKSYYVLFADISIGFGDLCDPHPSPTSYWKIWATVISMLSVVELEIFWLFVARATIKQTVKQQC